MLHTTSRLIMFTLISATLLGCDDKPAETEVARPVRTVIATSAPTTQTLTQTGEIKARFETAMAFRVNGRVEERRVDVGDRVAQDQVLAVLDDADLTNEAKTAEANLASISAEEINAHANYNRQKSLFEKGHIAKAALDTAEAQWRSMLARREATEATLSNARLRLGYAILVATSAGVVTEVGVNPGQVVATGQMAVRIASDGEREAVFSVSEQLLATDLHHVDVKVSLTTNPDITVTGRVREVSPSADPVTRTYLARVTLPDAPEAMTLGATVLGAVVSKDDMAIRIPASAISSAPDSAAVYVVDPATSRLARRSVEIARHTDEHVIVKTGLRSGERVVIAGVSRLRPDQLVKVEENAP